jgi:hypothetical protein
MFHKPLRFLPATLLFVLLAAFVAPAADTAFNHIEDMSGWSSCTGCAGGGGEAVYSMHQHQASPAMDGSSAGFSLGGTKPFSHALFWRRMSSNGTASNFVLDMYYYIDKPQNSQALEFAANQSVSNYWYKFSTQCNFNSGEWRVWNSKGSAWVSTGIGCNRPPANTWQHVVFEYTRSGGYANFISITVDGNKHYVNRSFSPQKQKSSNSVGIHFQLDGNATQSDYKVWTDCITLTYW